MENGKIRLPGIECAREVLPYESISDHLPLGDLCPEGGAEPVTAGHLLRCDAYTQVDGGAGLRLRPAAAYGKYSQKPGRSAEGWDFLAEGLCHSREGQAEELAL